MNQKYEREQKKKNKNLINKTVSGNILLGEDKKNLYMNNLNSSMTDDSIITSNEAYYDEFPQDNTNIIVNNINEINNIKNKFSFINSIKNQKNKRINIINFLCVPKILYLIEFNKKPEKYIFMLTPDESSYLHGVCNYKLIWRDLINENIENEVNIKDINKCFLNNKHFNRFIIEVEDNKLNRNKIELEAPNSDICEHFVNGINFLLKKIIWDKSKIIKNN